MKEVTCKVCGVVFGARQANQLCSAECRRVRRKEQQRQYYLRNPEKCHEASHQWAVRNSEKIKEAKRQRYLQNPEKARERSRQYQSLNREKHREYQHQYYLQNLEKRREYNRQYQAHNREKCREYKRQYRIQNPEKYQERQRQYSRQYYLQNPEKYQERQRQRRAHIRLEDIALIGFYLRGLYDGGRLDGTDTRTAPGVDPAVRGGTGEPPGTDAGDHG